MAEWTVCPQCSLKHSRRPDGLCPRCHTRLGEAEAATDSGTVATAAPTPSPSRTPSASSTPAPLPEVYDGRPLQGTTLSHDSRASPGGEVSLGARLGGAVLLANGLALLIESGLNVTMNEGKAGAVPFRPAPLSMLIDLVLGGMLLLGNPKGLPWAKFRVIAGGLVLPILFFSKGQTFLGGLQIAFSAGMALLLFGQPGRIRLTTGLLATGFGLALETIGLFGMATGTAPLARVQLAGSLEKGPAELVQGLAYPYHVTAGGGHWYLRKAEVAKKDNPLADRWLVWPEKDAHVLVIAERLEPGLVVDMDKFAEVVLGNARKPASDLRLITRDPLPAGGTRLHTRGTVNGMAIESYYGLFAREPWIFQVVAFTTQRQFESVKADLDAIIASFEAPRP